MVKIVILMVISLGSWGFASGQGDRVWVQRPDGALSCEKEKAQSLEAAAEELKQAQVEVFAMRKQNDGKMRIQVCGTPAGSMNAFEIRRKDLPAALDKGFKEVVVKKEK